MNTFAMESVSGKAQNWLAKYECSKTKCRKNVRMRRKDQRSDLDLTLGYLVSWQLPRAPRCLLWEIMDLLENWEFLKREPELETLKIH